MAEESQSQPGVGGQDQATPRKHVDEAFFTCVNQFVKVANDTAQQAGPQRVSVASLYAAARFNAHVYLGTTPAAQIPERRTEFLDNMGKLYRRMLNQHLDSLGEEHKINVGESELKDIYATVAAGGGAAGSTPAADYVAAAGAVPPADQNE